METGRRIDDLLKRREEMLARLNAKISQEKRREDSRTRKEDTRHKILVGACVLLAMEADSAVGLLIEKSLAKHAIGRDMEFLRKKGWRL